MTILCFDQKILAADTLTSSNDTTSYNRSKIKIVKQTAIVSCGLMEDGFRFEDWYKQQNRESFIPTDSFAAFVMTTQAIQSFYNDEKGDEISCERVVNKCANGSASAASYSEALMRETKMNAHKACELAAQYDRACGLPVYSITQKQLAEIHQDFEGFWIGDYKVPLNKIEEYLITYKQWLRS
jgi:hypothetical protein